MREHAMRLERASLAVSMLFLVVLFCLVLTDVVLRSQSIEFYWGSEGSGILMAWMIFLTLPLVNRQRSHIATDFLTARFPPWMRAAVGLLGQLLMLGYIVVLAWLCAELARRNWTTGARSQGILRLPLYYLQTGVVVGLGLMIVSQVMVIIDDFRSQFTGKGART